MMALAGVEPETLVSEPDALTTRPPPLQAVCVGVTMTSTGICFNMTNAGEK